MTLAAFLLADGRFPAGGHAHSGGVEAAIADGRIRDEVTLAAYVRGRLFTAGLTDAALAAATATRLDPAAPRHEQIRALRTLDAEADARLLAPPLRTASRRLGRQLVRAASQCWSAAVLGTASDAFPDGLHQACALGAVGMVAGLAPVDVGRLAVHHTITTPAQAAVRLLGLDPFAVVGITARLADDGEGVVRDALAYALGALHDLPARTGPVVEIAAMEHARWDVRMFNT